MNTIVCAIDFSRHTDAVLAAGSRIAEAFGAGLILFHSVPFPTDPVAGTDSRGRNRKMDEARERIEERMQGAAVPWEVAIGTGDPVDALAELAGRRDADLIVAASHRLSGIQRLLVGAIVERTARSIPKPLLVERRRRTDDSRPRFRRIVAGCPMDPTADEVVRFALRMARQLDAELHLVHAAESPFNEEVMDPLLGPYTRVQEEMQQRIRWRLSEAVSDMDRYGENVLTETVPGVPGEVLNAYAARRGADLIVVGVRRRGRVQKALTGSTTEIVLRGAPCAVLTVPFADGSPRAKA